MIQNYLNQYLKHFGQRTKAANQYTENQADFYYTQTKPIHKNFKRLKDAQLKDLNQKYVQPSLMCFGMKKPLFKNMSLKKDRQSENQSQQNSPDKVSVRVSVSPDKTQKTK